MLASLLAAVLALLLLGGTHFTQHGIPNHGIVQTDDGGLTGGGPPG